MELMDTPLELVTTIGKAHHHRCCALLFDYCMPAGFKITSWFDVVLF